MKISSLSPKYNKYLIEYLKKHGEQDIPSVLQVPREFCDDYDAFFEFLLENDKRLEDFKFKEIGNW